MYNKNFRKQDLDLIIELIQKTIGINLKKYRYSFLKNSLEARVQSSGQKNLKSYYNLLNKNKDEMLRLISDLNIQVSWFFRNEITWSLLSKILLPRLIENKIKKKEKLIRIWSAGCSKGEEPYTMAILIKEELDKFEDKLAVQIFGTDVRQNSLAYAKRGIYGKDALKNIPFGLLTKYFDRSKKMYQIKSSVKGIVYLSEFDMLSKKHITPPDAVYADFDIVLCRNVLIFYKNHAQREIFAKLSQSVAKGGFLILGETEEPVGSNKNEYKNLFNIGNIYQKY
jgi:chemotaxis methyl-accepting protein methylase